MPSYALNTSNRQPGPTDASGPGLPPASSAPVAAPSAAADPTYLAYLRGVGVEEAEIANVLGNRVGSLTRQLGRALPAYADKRAEAVEGAGNAAESRGFFRSGMRMRDQFRAGRDVDRERMNFEAETRDQIADAYTNAAADVARKRRELTEQGINSSQNVTLANAQAGIY